MSGTAQRLQRLLALVPWLRTHPGATVTDAARTFAITESQLRADIELLFCCGLPGGSPGDLIDIVLEEDRIIVLDPQQLDRPLRLLSEEALALLVAVRALADVPGLIEREALERVQRKLEEAIGADPAAPNPLEVALTPSTGDSLRLLREGVEQRRRVHLRYLGAARDEVTERDVDPMRLLLREGYWYLEGWCHRAEAVRLFRTDRVESVALLDVPAAPPPQAVPRDLADGLFQPSPEHMLIELSLRDSARWVADYYPCEYAHEQPDGTLHIGVRTPGPDWVRALVLRLGAQVTVLAPASFAADVGDWAERALAGYPDLATPD